MRLKPISFYTLAIVISATACTTNSDQSDIFREAIESLPSGVKVSVEISSPNDGDVFAEGQEIAVDGFATIGQGAALADTSLIFLVDVSFSTDNPAQCGGDLNDDGDFNTVLDCEIEALLAVNQTAIKLESVRDIGLAVFASKGGTADVQPGGSDDDRLTQPDADLDLDGQLDMHEALRSMQYGSIDEFTARKVSLATSYGAGLQALLPILEASEEPHKLVIMVSDGGNNTAPHIDTALPDLPPGTVVHTFAIGDWASCAKASEFGTLQEIANATGGTCTNVPTVSELPHVLPEVLEAKLTGLELRVDGQSVDIDDMDAELPEEGPVSINYATTVDPLAPGEHLLCATATGYDGSEGDVTECVTILVNSPPTLECDSHFLVADDQCQAEVSIDGGALDPDGDFVNCVVEPAGPYPIGITDVTMTCTDDWGAVSACDTVVEVVDETPPQIAAQSKQLWPANHKYHSFSPSDCLAVAADSCSEAELDLDAAVELISVTSDEGHDELGDGCTCADSIVIDGNTFKVRAERLASSNGRTYEATYKLTDEYGNESVASCQIVVPKSPNTPVVNDGGAVCVGDGCDVQLSLDEQCKKQKP
jgi:hypothetical protein